MARRAIQSLAALIALSALLTPSAGDAAPTDIEPLPTRHAINAMLSQVLGQSVSANEVPALIVSDARDQSLTIDVFAGQGKTGTASLRIEKSFARAVPVDPSVDGVERIESQEVFGILEAAGGWEYVWAHLVSTTVTAHGVPVTTRALAIRDFGDDVDTMFDRARHLVRPVTPAPRSDNSIWLEPVRPAHGMLNAQLAPPSCYSCSIDYEADLSFCNFQQVACENGASAVYVAALNACVVGNIPCVIAATTAYGVAIGLCALQASGCYSNAGNQRDQCLINCDDGEGGFPL